MSVAIPKAELIEVSELKVDGENPNRMTDKQLARLKSSIEKYGFIVPIITNRDLLVADGEQRFKVAEALGMKEVPVIRLAVKDVDRRLLRQVLNKLRGEHELIADALEFERIIEAGHEDELKHLLDLSDSQLERYLSEIRESKDEDYEIPEIDKIQTDIKRGDIYQLGSHRLMCGDATSKPDVEALMDGEKADMVFIDPPYGIDYSGGRTQVVRNRPYGKVIGDDNPNVGKFVAPFLDFAQDTYVCSSPRNLLPVLTAFANNGGADAVIVWKKNHPGLGYQWVRRYCEFIIYKTTRHKRKVDPSEFDWWDVPTPTTSQYIHGTQKPVRLVNRAIVLSAPETVADLYGGSGTTLIASEQTGRTCYMMEIDPRYVEVICQRWEKYTGGKREKLNITS